MKLEQMRELLSKATPGPWGVDPRDCKFYQKNADFTKDPQIIEDRLLKLGAHDDWLGAEIKGPQLPEGRGTFTVPDAVFIAMARNNFEKLLRVAEAAIQCMPSGHAQACSTRDMYRRVVRKNYYPNSIACDCGMNLLNDALMELEND